MSTDFIIWKDLLPLTYVYNLVLKGIKYQAKKNTDASSDAYQCRTDLFIEEFKMIRIRSFANKHKDKVLWIK